MSKTRAAATQMDKIRPFYVMELLARAKELEAQGRSIIHMEIREPDFNTPSPIIQAGKQALDDGQVHYTPATGIPELRKAIVNDYQHRYGVAVDAARVLVTPRCLRCSAVGDECIDKPWRGCING